VIRALSALLLWGVVGACGAVGLPERIAAIKPSVVGVGRWDPQGSPQGQLAGTGFFVGDGLHIATSYHLEPVLVAGGEGGSRLAVFIPHGKKMEVRAARRIRHDVRHDLALLRIEGQPGKPVILASTGPPAEGEAVAVTGFPIANTLGLIPLTNAGIVSSVSPITMPRANAEGLTAQQIRLLRKPFEILILDMIAYPGNSGSPVYAQASGAVVGIVGGVYVKQAREGVLTDPSAITYAIPVHHLQKLLDEP
jgi:S1-C subfamily serine protease